MKSLWRGVFNYNRDVEILYAYAASKKQAWLVMCKRMAKKQGVIPSIVMNYFDGSRPNYEITIEMEVKEDE